MSVFSALGPITKHNLTIKPPITHLQTWKNLNILDITAYTPILNILTKTSTTEMLPKDPGLKEVLLAFKAGIQVQM